MTQENYMALADVQEVWTEKQKPFIRQTFATKAELQDVEQKLEGPYYDEEHRSVVYPDYEDARYNPQTKGIYL